VFVQDATRFLLRHYQMIAAWPLRIYSSAIIFTSKQSIVKKENSHKLPYWLINKPRVEEKWTSLIQTLAGHSNSVMAVAYSLDGQRIASGSNDNIVRVWDATTGQMEQTLIGHSDWVSAVAFSPNGRRIVSGSGDKTVRVWDVIMGQMEQTLTGHSHLIRAVTFSPDGQRIALGSGDNTIRVWDATSGQVEQTLIGHSHLVSVVTFSPNGRRIASGFSDNTIRVWDATTGQIEQTLTGQSDSVYAVAFSPDGRRIASGSGDNTVGVWDVNGQIYQEVRTFKPVLKSRFSANGTYLVTNLGPFKVGMETAMQRSQGAESFHCFHVNAHWVCCHLRPVLRLPVGFVVGDYDVHGDQLAIGFANGQVLTLAFDSKQLLFDL
jgi:WD40 repeat protein